ncbi:MAG: PIN domain-containing protein [Bacillota bacterium]
MARNLSKICVDSGGFIALVYKSDLQHKKATQFYERVKQKAVFYTTNMVISETYTWLRYHVSHTVAVKFLDVTEEAALAGELRIIGVDGPTEEKARQILGKYSDQDFSYVDATSFAILDLLEIADVFGFDAHYRIFGKNLHP